MNFYTVVFRPCTGDVGYGKTDTHVIVDNLSLALVKLLKLTSTPVTKDFNVLEADEELESHAILKQSMHSALFVKVTLAFLFVVAKPR